MKRFLQLLSANDDDALRLLGLSRIPRCAECDVLDALRVAHETREPSIGPLPPVPRDCGDQVCRPLVARYLRPRPTPVKERPASQAALLLRCQETTDRNRRAPKKQGPANSS